MPSDSKLTEQMVREQAFAMPFACPSYPRGPYRFVERGFLIITHYQRLLNYIVPDVVHVLIDGRIVRSGGKELAFELEDKGYAWLEEPLGAGEPVGA